MRNNTLEPGDGVELAPGFDHLYNPNPLEGRFTGVFVGCRAKVKDKRDDSVGFPHIFIEWDKDDWRYEGMEDGWTFENHFRKVPQRISEVQDNSDLIIRDFIKQQVTDAEDRVRQEDTCGHCGQVHSERQVDFVENLMGAEDKILRSDGYFILALTPSGSNTEVYRTAAALTEDIEEEMEREIIRIAAELILQRSRGGR